MRTAVRTAIVGLLSFAAANGASAQLAPKKVTVTPIIGTIRWDDASALANKEADAQGRFNKNVITPTAGLSADYDIYKGLGLGVYFEAARPTTRGDYFPAALFNYGSRVELHNVSQRVTVLMYGLQGSYTANVGQRLLPYISGGAGAVTVNGDPEQTNSNASFSHGQFQFGGGLGYRMAGGAIRLDVRNYTFTGWKREELNPVAATYQNTQFPEANGVAPTAKKTVNNFRIALGFSFVPSRGGDTGGDTTTPGQE